MEFVQTYQQLIHSNQRTVFETLIDSKIGQTFSFIFPLKDFDLNRSVREDSQYQMIIKIKKTISCHTIKGTIEQKEDDTNYNPNTKLPNLLFEWKLITSPDNNSWTCLNVTIKCSDSNIDKKLFKKICYVLIPILSVSEITVSVMSSINGSIFTSELSKPSAIHSLQ